MTSDETLESALIARLLLFPDQLSLLNLAPEDFTSREWREVYRAMQAMAAEHRVIDLASLRSVCPGVDFRGLLNEVSPAHRAPAEDYAKQIKDISQRRRLVAELETVTAKAHEEDIERVLADLSSITAKAMAGSSSNDLLSPDQAVNHYRGVLGRRAAGERGLSWVPNRLNDYLQPARAGEYVLVIARPSVGKTIVAEMLADHWAGVSKKPVLFVSLEMSVEKLLDRALIRNGGVARGVLDTGDVARAGEALSARKNVDVWYLRNARATTHDIRVAAARVKLLGRGLGAIVLDYLGLVRDKGDNENIRLSRISGELKALALEHDIPVLVLSQLNRNSTRRDDPVPRLDDIRDSGAPEQDCDICLGLHRVIGENEMTVRILKNRDGAAGQTMYLRFNEHLVTVS